MNIQKSIRVLVLCMGLVLASCGGGSDSGSTSPVSSTSPTSSTVSMTGVVVDGYLGGATAFLDLNGNGSLDAGEPSAITKSDGTYNLLVTAAQAAVGASIVVDVPSTAIDADTGKEVGQRFVMSAPPVAQGTRAVISPMTTLVKSQMDKYANLTVAEAEANVKDKIGLAGSNVDLLSDYVAAKKTGAVNAADYERVHSIARVSAQAVKNNIASIEAAVKASGTTATLNDIVTLIVDQVLAELTNIALQVDLVPASTLDPAAALANTNVNNISTTNIQADIATIQTIAKKPVITLHGSNQMTVVKGVVFSDPGAVAISNVDGDISSKIKVSGAVDTAQVGFYTLSYDVADAAGNQAQQVLRIVQVVAAADTVAPIITVNGAVTVSLNAGTLYNDRGATLDDPYATLTTTGYVNTAKSGRYTITYNAVDGAGNAATPVTRTVNVVDATPPSVFQLLGSANVSIIQGGSFTDPGVFAWDATDGDISNNVVITGTVNTQVQGTYTLTYNVSDKAGNAAQAITRTVNVTTETIPPVVTAPAAIQAQATGATTAVTLGTSTVTDNVSTGLTATASPVGPFTVGTHIITWTATDAAGNIGTAQQIVTIVDTTPPTITAPANITTPATAALTAVTLGTPTGVSDLTSTPSVLNNAPAAGFPVGVTTVTWTAIDAYNNTAAAAQTVTITDNVPPVVTAPANVSLFDTDTAGIAAFLNGASAIDNIDGTLTVSNSAPVSLPTGTTLVTFSATDTAGNTASAVASITLNVAGVGTNVPVTVRTDGVDQNTGQVIGTPGPIANAVVVVDGVEYITDVNGNTSVPSLDVGVHEMHVFADGYQFSSAYGYTADPLGNTVTISPATTTGQSYYDSWVSTLNLQMPAGYVARANSVMEVTITDPYGNTYATQASNTYDPYGVVYSTYSPIPTSFIPAFSSFSATIDITEITCDPYGFNCTKAAFAPFTWNLSTVDTGTVFSGAATPTNVAVPSLLSAPVAFSGNTADSQVIMDVNITNSVLAVGTLDIYTQNVGAQVIFSVTDAYGVVNDYLANVQTSYNYGGFTDAYTNVFVPQNTVANNQATLNFYGIPPGSQVSGHLYVVEGNSIAPSYILEPGLFIMGNYVDLGVVSLTTTAYPYIYSSALPASKTVNAAFPLVPVLPVADAAQGRVSLELSISNSVYSDPYTVLPSNSFPSLSLSFTTTDVYGNPVTYDGSASVSITVIYDAYGTATTSVDVGPALGELFIPNDLAIGSTITGVLTVTESLITPPNFPLNPESTSVIVNQVDLGLHTFTVTANRQTWQGYNIPLVGIVNTPTPVSVVFPLTPPTPTTVLTVQSVAPPAGMVIDSINVSDNYGYFDYLGAWSSPIVLPHAFTSWNPPQGVLGLNIHASDPYSNWNWGVDSSNLSVGSVFNYSSTLTLPTIVAANQSGNVINFNTVAGATTVRFMIGDNWNIFVDPAATSFTLPPVPLSINNPYIVGQQYNLSYEFNLIPGFSHSSLMTSYNSDSGGQTLLNGVSFEYLGDYIGVPYTY
ncbi:MAG: DUF5011 domain-containing protein [Ghiorsea sp.]|nr:DUF5011 domain-containing protein [Ghiorsea sp.]